MKEFDQVKRCALGVLLLFALALALAFDDAFRNLGRGDDYLGVFAFAFPLHRAGDRGFLIALAKDAVVFLGEVANDVKNAGDFLAGLVLAGGADGLATFGAFIVERAFRANRFTADGARTGVALLLWFVSRKGRCGHSKCQGGHGEELEEFFHNNVCSIFLFSTTPSQASRSQSRARLRSPLSREMEFAARVFNLQACKHTYFYRLYATYRSNRAFIPGWIFSF